MRIISPITFNPKDERGLFELCRTIDDLVIESLKNSEHEFQIELDFSAYRMGIRTLSVKHYPQSRMYEKED